MMATGIICTPLFGQRALFRVLWFWDG